MKNQPVGIVDFSVITALGNNHDSQLQNALSGSLSGMVEDVHFLGGQPTYVGKVTAKLPPIPEAFSQFNHRANRLLSRNLIELDKQIAALKETFPLHRIGIIMATSTSGIDNLEQALAHYDSAGQWPPQYHIDQHRMGCVSEFVAKQTGVLGPVMTVSTACSSANKALASAKRWLNSDICDAVICGGVDVLTQLTLRGFDALGALSYQQSQPFSKNRQGINIGEASALFILSNETCALNLLGTGESTDAYHISAPDPSGNGAAEAIKCALTSANISIADIDYINLHGTGTPQNDLMEAAAIHQVFKDRASTVPCSSSKPQIGHTLGVSGMAELALTLLTMQGGTACLPHVFDGEYDDAILPLNLVQTQTTHAAPEVVLSNSFAFGGSNAVVIVGKNR